MTNSPFYYYLRPINKNQSTENIYLKIIEYLISFVGDIEIKKENEKTSTIYYIGTPNTTLLKLEKTGQITVGISPNDNVSINLINNISQSLGFRIYNPQINCYLPNDVNIYDLTTIEIDQNIDNVIKKYHLFPLFQYRDSLIFFAKAKDNSIHLINRHLLEYLKDNTELKIHKDEFSVKVSQNISEFIALFDRGLISLNFQKNLSGSANFINLSGFDFSEIKDIQKNKLPKDISLSVINFSFDEDNQSFLQEDTTDEIKTKKYLAIKIGQDYTYKRYKGKLIKVLKVSVYN